MLENKKAPEQCFTPELFRDFTVQFLWLYLNTYTNIYGIISARGNAEIGKKSCAFVLGAVKMYKYRSKQISLTDFNTPVGMKLNPNNRWVKKAELIPWDEIEQR